MEKKHIVVVISPDGDTDCCYLDMSVADAMERFKKSEDWINIYEPKGIEPKISEINFDDSFMLWRNMGNGIADILKDRGVPPELQSLFKHG